MTRFEIANPVIVAELATPYEYGKADCFFFGCRVADALDPAREMVARYSGSYKTLMGAQKALRKRGYTSLVELFAAHLERQAPAKSRFGDIAILELPDGEHVGVFSGQRFVTKTERGQRYLDITAAKAAFRT